MTIAVDQLLLPFAEKEYVDVRRAAAILGVGHQTIIDLYASGKIEMIDYAKRKRKRVRYQSIVDFCERLRTKHSIRDRRPPLSPNFRHRDADLLPFPLEDTMTIDEVVSILGYCSKTPIYLMIEEGRFEAYQLDVCSPWRISRSSLAEYLKGVHSNARVGSETRV
jgi:excisionase family DNA binding protein